MKKAEMEALLARIRQEKQEREVWVHEALELAGQFYDELLLASEAAGPRLQQERFQAVRRLQTDFYRQCVRVGMSVLTPRQQRLKGER